MIRSSLFIRTFHLNERSFIIESSHDIWSTEEYVEVENYEKNSLKQLES